MVYKEPIMNLLFVLAILSFVLISLIGLFLKFHSFFASPKLWFISSIIIYIICMAGVVHNIIHNTPFT